MVGRELPAAAERQQDSNTADIVLNVQSLSLASRRKTAQPRLQNISFDLQRGEILGLAGLLGAGRTELLECLAGAGAERYSGRILLVGKPCELQSPAEAVRAVELLSLPKTANVWDSFLNCQCSRISPCPRGDC
ncbi:MAG UNVERIFIED_CONTAM: ATP-binding cassette domain-containing protein [Planctomycetaceae bacterium]|jgi:ABC-type sugar transport system ATPase subunit